MVRAVLGDLYDTPVYADSEALQGARRRLARVAGALWSSRGRSGWPSRTRPSFC